MKNILLILFSVLATVSFSQQVVINEVYGAGGNSGAAFRNDYVELFNPGSLPVELSGWSVQYASATATGTWQVAVLSGLIQPGRYYLLQLAAGAGNGQALPTADASGTIGMSASAGKVALVNSVTVLTGNCPTGAQIIDRVGYGSSANCFDGTGPSVSPSATLSIMRRIAGADTDNNTVDFQTVVPNPQNGQPMDQTISFSPLQERRYGDPSSVVVATASSGLPVTLSSTDQSVASVDGFTVTIHSAGETTLFARQGGDAGFNAAPEVGQALRVNKAILTATADPKTRFVGEVNPVFTLSYSGFIGADAPGMIDLPPTLASSANLSSPPGDYPITLSGGTDKNYGFVLVPGKLTVANPVDVPDVYITSPVDGMTDVAIPITVMVLPVRQAKLFTIQISKDASFSTFVEKTGGRRQSFSTLDYNTSYFVRVRTNLSEAFGRTTRFVTGRPEQFTYLLSPSISTSGVDVSPRMICNPVVGATAYTIQVSTASDLTGMSIVQTGLRSQWITGLLFSTTYYVRVKTDLSPTWGPTKSFVTRPDPGAESSATLSTLRQAVGQASSVKAPGAMTEQEPQKVRMGIVAYPNPFTDAFVLMCNTAEKKKLFLRIVNVQGVEVFAGEVDLTTQLQLGVDWTPGVYIIYGLGKERNEVFRVVKR